MLTFVGLGLYDLEDISLRGMQAIKDADSVFLESYTSKLMGTSVAEMEERYGKPVIVLHREDVEQFPEPILSAAEQGKAVFLTGGDPMVSTTHMDLRIRARERGIPTTLIHGASISTAICGLSGLQNYRFGKSCSVPYPVKNWFPTTPIETIQGNIELNLHTLVFLDIQKDRYMTIHEAIEILGQMAHMRTFNIPLYVGIARAGSDNPKVHAGSGDDLKRFDFGPPLHILVIPAQLHQMEEEYLKLFAGYCESA